MTTIIVVTVIGTILIALTSVWEEFMLATDIAISDEDLSADKEESCRCRTCLARKEQAMYLEAATNPNAFLTEIAKANGTSSMQMVLAKQIIS